MLFKLLDTLGCRIAEALPEYCVEIEEIEEEKEEEEKEEGREPGKRSRRGGY
jgi:hypothetical protein